MRSKLWPVPEGASRANVAQGPSRSRDQLQGAVRLVTLRAERWTFWANVCGAKREGNRENENSCHLEQKAGNSFAAEGTIPRFDFRSHKLNHGGWKPAQSLLTGHPIIKDRLEAYQSGIFTQLRAEQVVKLSGWVRCTDLRREIAKVASG